MQSSTVQKQRPRDREVGDGPEDCHADGVPHAPQDVASDYCENQK